MNKDKKIKLVWDKIIQSWYIGDPRYRQGQTLSELIDGAEKEYDLEKKIRF